MPNTFKKSTFLYIAAALVVPYIIRPMLINAGFVLGLGHLWVITIPVFGFLAYRSFRKGAPAAVIAGTPAATLASTPVAPSTGRKPTRTRIIAGLGVIAVILIGYSVRTGHLFVPNISKPPIEGAYLDKTGVKIEFMGDGTLIVPNGTARWSRVDDTRIRIEPAQISILAQVCQYRFRTYRDLSIGGCDFQGNLTRL